MTRAKFRCNQVTQNAGSDAKQYSFAPVYDTSIPEDLRYSKYTPSGSLTLHVDNPAVNFELGKQYYIDITPAGE